MPPTHPLPALASTDLLIAFAGYERAVLCLSEKTVRNHRIYLDAYLDWWHCGHGLTPVATARPGEVAAFLIAEANRGLAPRTRRSELGALRGFYNWLVLTGRALTNPGAAVPSPRISAPPIEIYTPAESIAILDHTASLTDLRGRQRHAIVATLRHTGMRSGELRTLRRADLDLSAGRAMVVGKGSRQRMVLLPPALCPILGQFVAQDRPLLPSSPLLLVNPHPLVTTPLSGFGMDALAREVELAGLGAGLGGRHYPHKWRHTFATEMVRAGVDIHVVQRLLGHAHISSTVGCTWPSTTCAPRSPPSGARHNGSPWPARREGCPRSDGDRTPVLGRERRSSPGS